MKPLVSIIIPLFNCEKYIKNTVLSALNQSWPNKEIIVVNDGSSDNSLKQIDSFIKEKNIVYVEQGNKGGSAARNKGLEIASGEYIQFLDADDLLAADKIEVQMQSLYGREDVLIHGLWARFVNDPKKEELLWEPEKFVRKDLKAIEWLCSLQTSACHSWLTPRKLIDKAGKWNEDLILNQDGEFFSRVVAQSEEVIFNHESKVYYRSQRPGSVTKKYAEDNAIISNYTTCQLFEELILNIENSERTREACANKYMKFVYAYYPKRKDIMDKVLLKIDSLGGSTAKLRYKGKLGTLSKVIGWKRSLELKNLINNYRLSG